MSDMHVTAGDAGRNWSIVLHIPVPCLTPTIV
jgi:hypothetical protein